MPVQQQDNFNRPVTYAGLRVMDAVIWSKLQQLIGDYPNDSTFVSSVAGSVATALASNTTFIAAVAAAVVELQNQSNEE